MHRKREHGVRPARHALGWVWGLGLESKFGVGPGLGFGFGLRFGFGFGFGQQGGRLAQHSLSGPSEAAPPHAVVAVDFELQRAVGKLAEAGE